MKTIRSMLITVSFLLISQTVTADGWPTSIVGSWSANANNTIGTLNVTFQSTAGLCRTITGNIFGNPIQRFYCPFSGRVHFLRKNALNNDTFQVYSANLSQSSTGAIRRMGGSFTDYGQPGEYSFFASK